MPYALFHTRSYVNRNATMTKSSAGTARPRDAAKQETREALLRAATDLFRSEGLDASLDAVCARAGFTRGAFYVHFRDRDELLSAAIERILTTLIDTLFGPPGSEDEFPVLVQRFLATVASGHYPISRDGSLRPYQLLDACARSDAVRAQYLRLISTGEERLTVAIRRAQARAEVRDDVEAILVAKLLMGMVLGMQTMLDLQVPLDLPALARLAMQLLTPAAVTK